MDVIVMAGGMPGQKDALYAATQGGYKAMLEVAGKPMIQWVLDALSKSPSVQRVAVVGLPPLTALDCEKPLVMLANTGEMVENVRAGAVELSRHNPDGGKVLILPADIPAVTAEMVEWLVAQIEASNHDLYGFVLNRKDVEALNCNEQRVFAHLKDAEVCLADAAGLMTSFANQVEHPLWKKMIEARKSPTRQAALLGYDVLFLLMLRQLKLKEAEAAINRRLGVDATAILCPYAELALDVDRPRDLEVLNDLLSKRAAVGGD